MFNKIWNKAWQYPPPDLVFSVGRAMVEEVAGLYL